MLQIVLEAVKDMGEPVVVGGPLGIVARQVPAGNNFVESVAAGLQAVRSESFLLATVDVPFLTAEAVADFVARCDLSAGLNYPIIDQRDSDAQFPGMARTTLRMSEGVFTGGNLGLVRKAAMERAMPVLERAYAARKSPLHLANMVGFSTLGRVALGRVLPRTLRLAMLEAAVSRFLGMEVKAVRTTYASIGADIDTAEQYLAALPLLKSENRPIP